jgi:hypothetical protein
MIYIFRKKAFPNEPFKLHIKKEIVYFIKDEKMATGSKFFFFFIGFASKFKLF